MGASCCHCALIVCLYANSRHDPGRLSSRTNYGRLAPIYVGPGEGQDLSPIRCSAAVDAASNRPGCLLLSDSPSVRVVGTARASRCCTVRIDGPTAGEARGALSIANGAADRRLDLCRSSMRTRSAAGP